jgi:hypothetical protein
MPPSNFKRKWIKLFIDECLTGTIREELRPDERSVWYDFLLLAGRNRPPGCISANEDTPLSPARLSSILNVSEALLARSIKKFEDEGRIEFDLRGIVHIINWDKYQYTDYDRQKPYRQRSILKRNQQYLEEHPEEVVGELGDENRTDKEIEQDRKKLARGDTPLEVHENAMLKANPHLADGLPE